MAIPHLQSNPSRNPYLRVEKLVQVDLAKLGLKRPIHRPAVARPPAVEPILAAPPIAGELQRQTVSCIPTHKTPFVPKGSANTPSYSSKSDVHCATYDRHSSFNRNLVLSGRINRTRAIVPFGVQRGRKRKTEFDIVLDDWAGLHYFRCLTWEPVPEDYGSDYDEKGRRSSRRAAQRLLITTGNSQ